MLAMICSPFSLFIASLLSNATFRAVAGLSGGLLSMYGTIAAMQHKHSYTVVVKTALVQLTCLSLFFVQVPRSHIINTVVGHCSSACMPSRKRKLSERVSMFDV